MLRVLSRAVLSLAGFVYLGTESQKRLELYAVLATIAAGRWRIGIPELLRFLQERINEREINFEFKRFRHEQRLMRMSA